MQLPYRLGGFELTQRLGSGAMGTVYAALQTSLGRRVVIKTLHPHLMEDPGLIARFEREARHAAGLQHPNTVQVYEFGREGNLHYIAMEFVDGLDLKEVLSLLGPFPPEIVTLVLRDVCRGMEAAHQRDLVHRDIKPANLMITRGGVVKVMDFGLARETAESSTLTQHGSVMGSAAYMSPEQAQGQTVDHRTDVFSTGLVGYEISSGERAFPGESYASVLRAVVFDEVRPLVEQRAGLPDELYEVVHWMTVKDLAGRCPSMSAARDRLEALAQRLGLRGEDRILSEFVRRADAQRPSHGAAPGLPPVDEIVASAETVASPGGPDGSGPAGTGPGGSDRAGTLPGGTGAPGAGVPSGGTGPGAGSEALGTRVADPGPPAQGTGSGATGPGSTPSARPEPARAAAGPAVPTTPSSPARPAPAPAGAGAGGGTRKLAWGALGLLVVAIAAFGGWKLFGGGSDATRTGGDAIRGGNGDTALVEVACCFDDGTCELFAEAECREQRGTPGTEPSCEPNPCPQPARGACCLPDGGCVLRTRDDCRSGGGEYRGDGTECRPSPCASPEGACCVDGRCRVLDAERCTEAGGAFRGPGSACDPDPCAEARRDRDGSSGGDRGSGPAGGRDGTGGSPGGTSGLGSGGTTEATLPPFEKRFAISTVPYAEVRVDDDPTNRNIVGNFEMVLKEGVHRFHVRNSELGVERTVTYRVRRDDPNNRIIIRVETGEVESRP